MRTSNPAPVINNTIVIAGSGGSQRHRVVQLDRIIRRCGMSTELAVSEGFSGGLYATRPITLAGQVARTVVGVLNAALITVRRRRNVSAILLTYPSLLEAVILIPLARLLRKAVIVDFYISLFDTLALDRELRPTTHPISRALYWLDRWMLKSSDVAITDTPENSERYAEMFRVPETTMLSIPVGYPTEFDHGRSSPPPLVDRTRVLFYGSFIPLHGAHQFVLASQDDALAEFDFTFVGTGQTRSHSEGLASSSAAHVTFIDWLDTPELIAAIDRSQIVLGIAGTSAKAMSVVPNKVYQSLARNRIVLTAKSPAIDRALGDAVITFDPTDHHSIVHQLLFIRDNYKVISENVQEHQATALRKCSDDQLTATMRHRLQRVLR